MEQLIPACIARAEKGPLQGRFSACVMFLDMAGSTVITRQLMENGTEGAEVLTMLMNRLFSPAIDMVYAAGGWISAFAGDAFHAIFPLQGAHEHQEEILRCLAAVRGIQQVARMQRKQQTKFGAFYLAVKIGLALGRTDYRIVSLAGGKQAYYFSGPAIMESAYAESYCRPGQIVAHQSLCDVLQDRKKRKHTGAATCRHLKHGFYLLEDIRAIPPGPDRPPGPAVLDPHSIERFLPYTLSDYNLAGEFRDVVSCFLAVKPVPGTQPAFDSILSRLLEYGGHFCDINFGDKGQHLSLQFGVPIAYENYLDRALDFALAVRETQPKGAAVKCGITYGPAFTGLLGNATRSTFVCMGDTLNLAVQLMLKAEWNSILVDESIYRLRHPQYRLLRLGALSFKGFLSVPCYRLEQKFHTFGLFDGPFVGRKSELRRLTDFLHPIHSGRFAGIAHIYGESGIGKSRLLNELSNRMGKEALFLVMQCDSIMKRSLNPFALLLQKFFGFQGAEGQEARLSRFRQAYTQFLDWLTREWAGMEKKARMELLNQARRIESFLAQVLAVSWEDSLYKTLEQRTRHDMVQEALADFFYILSHIKPLVLVIEDIHWIDADSAQAFDRIRWVLGDRPAAFIASSRYDTERAKPRLLAGLQPQGHDIELTGLPLHELTEVMAEHLRNKPSSALSRFVQGRTEGNPLYTEQYCLYLKENGLLKPTRAGLQLKAETGGKGAGQAELPADIKAILMSRFDRFSPGLRLAAQAASVMGREFDATVLPSILRDSSRQAQATLLPGHDYLADGQQQRLWHPVAAGRYRFHSSLLRQTIYTMQLRERLRGLHQLTAQALEKRYKEQPEHFAEIAFHYSRAYDEAGPADKEASLSALYYYLAAGRYETSRFHTRAAHGYFTRALAISARIHGPMSMETAMVHQLTGENLFRGIEHESALKSLGKALHIREKHQHAEPYALTQTLEFIGGACMELGRYQEALRVLQRSLAVRKELYGSDHVHVAETYHNLGQTYMCMGAYDQALSYYHQALNMRSRHYGDCHRAVAESCHNIGLVYAARDELDAAMEYLTRDLTISRKLLGSKHPDTATSLNDIAHIYFSRGDFSQAIRCLHQAEGVYESVFGPKHPSTANSYGNLALVYLETGDTATALTYMRKSYAILKKRYGSHHLRLASVYHGLAKIFQRMGKFAKALDCLYKDLDITQKNYGKDHIQSANSLSALASIYLDMKEFARAGGLLDQAFAIWKQAGDRNSIDQLFYLKLFVCLGQEAYAEVVDLVAGHMRDWLASHDAYTFASGFLAVAEALAGGTPLPKASMAAICRLSGLECREDAFFQQALALARHYHNVGMQIACLQGYGRYLARQDKQKGLELLQQGLDLAREKRRHLAVQRITGLIERISGS